jgi:hypothetical protein
MTGALVIFVATYLLIASKQLHFLKLDRPAGAVVGAVAMVLVGGLPMQAALDAIDLHVLVLLFGVLVIAAYLQEAQFFRYAAYLVLTRAKSARSLLFGLVICAARQRHGVRRADAARRRGGRRGAAARAAVSARARGCGERRRRRDVLGKSAEHDRRGARARSDPFRSVLLAHAARRARVPVRERRDHRVAVPR